MNNQAEFVNFNGAIIRAGKAILTADNRSFRYGDGLFETIKVRDGQILLAGFHFDRLMTGIRLLRLTPSSITPEGLAERLGREILALCTKNGHNKQARVRLVVFRGDGNFYEARNTPNTPHAAHTPDASNTPHAPNTPNAPALSPVFPDYIIQSWALPETSNHLNEDGWTLDIFPDGRKSCDSFANLKSNNYLVYVLAALHARQLRLNDCLVLNSHQRIADSTIANVFYTRGGQIYTPPLSEGCVAGVMRRYLIENLPRLGFILHETETTASGLEMADEVFLTNALQGIRWVRSFRGISYTNQLSSSLYKALLTI